MALETGDFDFGSVFGPFDNSFDPATLQTLQTQPELFIDHFAHAGIPPPGPEFTEHFTGRLPKYAENFDAKYPPSETGVYPLPDQKPLTPKPIKTESIKPPAATASDTIPPSGSVGPQNPYSPDAVPPPAPPARLTPDALRAKGLELFRQRNPQPEQPPQAPFQTSPSGGTTPSSDPSISPPEVFQQALKSKSILESIKSGADKAEAAAERIRSGQPPLRKLNPDPDPAGSEEKKPTTTLKIKPKEEPVATAPSSKSAEASDYDTGPGRASAETDPRFARTPDAAAAVAKEEAKGKGLSEFGKALAGVKAPPPPPRPTLHPYGEGRPNPLPQNNALVSLLTGALGGNAKAAANLRLLQALGK